MIKGRAERLSSPLRAMEKRQGRMYQGMEGAEGMEGVWFTEGVWMLANYGTLDL